MSAHWDGVGPVRWVSIEGQPLPEQRPRVTKNGTYYPRPQVQQKKRWRQAWDEQVGETMEHDAVYVLSARFVMGRPASHFNTKGQLNALGRRRKVPPRGDIDNLLKLVLDGLNGVAYGDDVQVVRVDGLEKVYSDSPGYPGRATLAFCQAVPR